MARSAKARPLLPVALNRLALLDGKALGVSAGYRGIQVYDLNGDQASLVGALTTGLSPLALATTDSGFAFAPAGYDGVLRLRQAPLAYVDALDTPREKSVDVAPFSRGQEGYLAVADMDAGLRILSAGSAEQRRHGWSISAVPAATGSSARRRRATAR